MWNFTGMKMLFHLHKRKDCCRDTTEEWCLQRHHFKWISPWSIAASTVLGSNCIQWSLYCFKFLTYFLQATPAIGDVTCMYMLFIEYLAIIPVPPLRSKTYPQIAMGSWCSVIYIGNQSRPIFLSPSLSSVFFSDRTAVCRYGWENSC